MNLRIFLTLLVLAATWLLWSGHYQPLVLTFGALSCALVILLARRTGFFDKDIYALHLSPRLPRFWAWLLKEIITANFKVARIVLKRELLVRPTVVTVDASDLAAASQATLANSITLTPGTLTVDIHRGMIEVHCLTREIAAELLDGEMLRRARVLSGE